MYFQAGKFLTVIYIAMFVPNVTQLQVADMQIAFITQDSPVTCDNYGSLHNKGLQG